MRRSLLLFLLLSFAAVQAQEFLPDSGVPDSGVPDPFAPANVPDSGVPDSGVPDSGVPNYIHYEEYEDGASSLQTAVTRFEKDGIVVDLVSVVHLADESYYKTLDALLSRYDRVLYEMVGGAFQKEAPVSPDAAPEAGGMRQLQQMASSILGLRFQLDSIDYEAQNFVHADVDWESYQGLMSARNQSFSTFFMRALSLSEEGDLPGLPSSEAARQGMMQKLMAAVMTGNSNDLKRLLAPFLAESEALIAKLEGDDGTVLVTERNKVVMGKLAELMEGGDARSFAIFYGGGHMPDLEQRLLDQDFDKVETQWVNAWRMQAEGTAAASDAPAVNPLELLMRILSENPEIMKSLQGLGTGPLEAMPEEDPASPEESSESDRDSPPEVGSE